MTAVKGYYETYWSAEGFCPVGGLSGDVRRLFEREIDAADDCLDVGCGDGGTAGPWLTEHAAHYIGVDLSARAVAMARASGFDAHRIDDAGSLPFSDGVFDVVVCLEVFEHLFDPHAAATEIARVLRPGGRLIVTVPNVSHWKARVDLALRGRWDPRGDSDGAAAPWRDPHIRFFTPAALEAMLRQAGFATVTVSGRQGSIARNVHRLERFGRVEPGPLGRWATAHLKWLGAGLAAVAATPAGGR